MSGPTDLVSLPLASHPLLHRTLSFFHHRSMDRSAHFSCPPLVFHSAVQSPSFWESPASATSPGMPFSGPSEPAPSSLPSSLPHPLSWRPFGERVAGSARDGVASDVASTSYGGGYPWHGSRDEDVTDGEPDPLSCSARVRSCDVYLGFAGRTASLLRLVKWLRAELEMLGVSCFVSDGRNYRGARARSVARDAMDAAAFGVVVVTRKSFSNVCSMEEMGIFLERKKLVPIFLGLSQCDCVARDIVERRGELWERFGGHLWTAYGGVEREWMEVVNGLARAEPKIEVNASNYRDSIMDLVLQLGKGLGKRCEPITCVFIQGVNQSLVWFSLFLRPRTIIMYCPRNS